MNPDRIAQLGQLSMLIELSSSPKPGNVDRCHDFEDIGFQEFLISAVASYPVLRRAASGRYGVGRLILEAVESWKSWNLPGNTHFGSITLLVPLAAAASEASDKADLGRELDRVLKSTTIDDSVDFYKAFALAGARVADVDEFSLKSGTSLVQVRAQGKTLIELMRLSQGHDLIAREWSTCYQRSFQLSEILARNVGDLGLNCGVVKTYIEALAEEEDSLVIAKFGRVKAAEVKALARKALSRGSLSRESLSKGIMKEAADLDKHLISEDVNPGSTADLIASSLFIALLRGLKV